MSSTDVPQVKAYLAELERALDALPRDRRVEVLRDIRAHIGGALADGETSTARVSSVLDSLGTPQEIAEAAYEEMPPHGPANWPGGRGMAGRDIAAVILVLVGGFAYGIGWFAGVILLWTSQAWRTRDKWIGTLILPGGLLAAVAAPFLDAFGLPYWHPVGLIVVSAAPVFTTFWLIRTARRTPE